MEELSKPCLRLMPCDGDDQDWWVVSEQYLLLFPQTVLVAEAELMGGG